MIDTVLHVSGKYVADVFGKAISDLKGIYYYLCTNEMSSNS